MIGTGVSDGLTVDSRIRLFWLWRVLSSHVWLSGG